ncbi:DnaJ domain-containing protein [Campylobacter lari]|nr:DnaJ domain-containing protein [Campylobacter lari]MCV3419595.1 DnaJ domain-containing protein [Campylobacter lari]MCV3429008.1 DnaJ domain-containing protein [Campylobacter lari]HEC1773858.1 DnaJ domain-containing protein [Campylobacter lari]
MFSLKFKAQEYRICKYCSEFNPDKDAKFCIFCGKELYHVARQKFDYIYSKNPAIMVAFLAKVAKVDNKIITQDLSKFISSLLDKIEMFYTKEYSGFRNTYANIFEYEKNQGRSISELCSNIRISKKEADFLICLLLDLIYYDKQMSANENTLMENIIIGLGLNLISFREIKIRYEQIYNFTHENTQQKQEKHQDEIKITLEQAYEILNSHPNDNFESIKKNYRKLAKEYHYDNLHSKELPPELLKIAQEMMKKINQAYEIIKQARGE